MLSSGIVVMVPYLLKVLGTVGRYLGTYLPTVGSE